MRGFRQFPEVCNITLCGFNSIIRIGCILIYCQLLLQTFFNICKIPGYFPRFLVYNYAKSRSRCKRKEIAGMMKNLHGLNRIRDIIRAAILILLFRMNCRSGKSFNKCIRLQTLLFYFLSSILNGFRQFPEVCNITLCGFNMKSAQSSLLPVSLRRIC